MHNPDIILAGLAAQQHGIIRTDQVTCAGVSRRQYERLTGRYRNFFDAYEEFRKHVDLAELAIDPDELFAGTRDDTRGRNVLL